MDSEAGQTELRVVAGHTACWLREEEADASLAIREL